MHLRLPRRPFTIALSFATTASSSLIVSAVWQAHSKWCSSISTNCAPGATSPMNRRQSAFPGALSPFGGAGRFHSTSFSGTIAAARVDVRR